MVYSVHCTVHNYKFESGLMLCQYPEIYEYTHIYEKHYDILYYTNDVLILFPFRYIQV